MTGEELERRLAICRRHRLPESHARRLWGSTPAQLEADGAARGALLHVLGINPDPSAPPDPEPEVDAEQPSDKQPDSDLQRIEAAIAEAEAERIEAENAIAELRQRRDASIEDRGPRTAEQLHATARAAKHRAEADLIAALHPEIDK